MGNRSRTLAAISLVGLVIGVIATIVGHLGLDSGYDPLQLTISDYALSDRGAAIAIAMVALAFGSFALLAALARAGVRVSRLPAFLLSIWSLGLVVAAVVRTDPPGLDATSTAAYVHRYASVTAFVAMPIAAAVIASRMGSTWRRTAVIVRRLCAACGLSLGLFWWVAFPGHRVLLGLVERGLLGIELAILASLSVGVLRSAGRAGRLVDHLELEQAGARRHRPLLTAVGLPGRATRPRLEGRFALPLGVDEVSALTLDRTEQLEAEESRLPFDRPPASGKPLLQFRTGTLGHRDCIDLHDRHRPTLPAQARSQSYPSVWATVTSSRTMSHTARRPAPLSRPLRCIGDLTPGGTPTRPRLLVRPQLARGRLGRPAQ